MFFYHNFNIKMLSGIIFEDVDNILTSALIKLPSPSLTMKGCNDIMDVCEQPSVLLTHTSHCKRYGLGNAKSIKEVNRHCWYTM